MLLANYGSDSDSEDDISSQAQAGPSTARNVLPARAATVGTGNTSAVPGSASAASKAKVKRKGPVKITLDLPKASNADREDGAEAEAEEVPAVKKPKLDMKGKGSSALLGMLPPPKRKLPTSSKSTGLAVNKAMATPRPPPSDAPDLGGLTDSEIASFKDDDEDTGMMLPPSMRNKAKASTAAPSVDLFGLSSAAAPAPKLKPAPTPVPSSISSAPDAPDWNPPPPTPNDPYPGYYQTPSGEWKAYDPEYYASFFAPKTKLQGEKTEEDDGRVGRHWEEYDTKGADVLDVDVSESIKAARAEEERKKLTKRPKMPGEEFEYQAIGQIKGVAAQRHQLTSLLHTAYQSREELEDRIAQNKKSMRLAGQKYGF